MLYCKSWEKRRTIGIYVYRDVYTGWFLLGFIPLFITRTRMRSH